MELERALLMLEKLNIWLFMDSLYVGIAAFQVGVKTSIKLHITLEYQEWKGNVKYKWQYLYFGSGENVHKETSYLQTEVMWFGSFQCCNYRTLSNENKQRVSKQTLRKKQVLIMPHI